MMRGMDRHTGRLMLSDSLRRLATGLEVGAWRASDLRDLMRALRCVPGWLLEDEDALVARVLFLMSGNDLAAESRQGALLTLAWFLEHELDSEATAAWLGNVRYLMEREGRAPPDDEIRKSAFAVRPKPEAHALSTEAFAHATPAEKVEDILLRRLGIARECLVMGADVCLDFGLTEQEHDALLEEIERALSIEISSHERARLRSIGSLYDLYRRDAGEALHEAIARTRESEARALLEARPDLLDASGGLGGGTPLMAAIRNQMGKLAHDLIAMGADVSARNVDNETALHAAARTQLERVAECLVAAGADVDAAGGKAADGDTPLHVACAFERPAITRTLCEAGADVNCVSSLGGKTPLHRATSAPPADPQRGADRRRAEIVATLIEYGADPTQTDGGGRTPLRIAHAGGLRGVVRRLTPAKQERVGRPVEPLCGLELERETDGVLVFRFSGNLDVQIPYEAMSAAMAEHTLDRVLVDLSGIEFGAAAFKGLLAQLYTKTLEAAGRIVFLAPPREFMRQLEISKLTDYFDVHKEESSARNRLTGEDAQG